MKESVASKEYQLWWEVNQERILAQDKLRHEMDYKQGKGTQKLMDKLIANKINEKLDDYRENVLKSRWKFW